MPPPAIQQITARAFRIPTDRPESDGTLRWDATTMVTVHIDAGGRQGFGYTYTDTGALNVIRGTLAPPITGIDALDTPRCWSIMTRAIRNLGETGLARMAVAAVDTALWDLKAKLLELPLAALLGRVRDQVPVYGSGGFTAYPIDVLQAQLGGWAADGMGQVKMKIGRDPDQDPARIRAAREAIGQETALFVDANGAYDRKQALAMAGRTADNTLALDIVTYDGLRMQVGPTSDAEREHIVAQGGRRGEIYAGMTALRDRYADLIRQRYPDIPRRVSGYNLDDLLPEKGFHVARALVGSEGTLVTVLEATVRLVYRWPGRALVVLGYPDVYSAADHIFEIMAHEPVGCEGLDDKLIRFMKEKHLHLRDLPLLPEGNGWLMVEMGGHDKAEADQKAKKLMADLKKTSHPPSMKFFDDPEHEKMIWEIRESGLGATANIPGEPLAWPGWEDAAVPPERIGEYLRDFRDLMDEFGLDAALYGHFGQGCVHCRITFDLFSHDGIRRYREFIERAADLVADYNGSISGEHGDGQARAVLLSKMYGPELVEAFREFKSLWDPDDGMNPGKVVGAQQPDRNLRLGTDYAPFQADTFFKFPDDGGSFANATLRCVGVGKCRRTHDAFMCPSFLATREERHTTRGRTHLLFEMFRGDFIRDGWRSREVREALELCLSCKACKSECPVNVDMSTYKMEFLYHHYRRRLRPRHHYALGLMGYGAALARHAPGLANRLTGSAWLGPAVKWIMGTAGERPLPRFAEQTFLEWFQGRDRSETEAARQVFLYPDEFNNTFDPEVLKAALAVLERLNYGVLIPDRMPPSALPPMHFGFLKLAGRQLRKAVAMLTPVARRGIPILFAEPSVAAMFKDDLPKIWPNDRDVGRIVDRCAMLSEFIAGQDLELPHLGGRAILHNHCNQKAVLDAGAVHRLLDKMGLEFEEPQQGCCGMAGSFGYIRENYGHSMTIAEEHLLPAVRQADADTFIVAEAFSCRTQIRDGTSRRAMHTMELLQHALRNADLEKGRA